MFPINCLAKVRQKASMIPAQVSLFNPTAAQTGQWEVIDIFNVTHGISVNQQYLYSNHSNGHTVAKITLRGESVDDGPTAVSSSFSFQSPEIYSNAFCGGHSQLGNGSLLVVGGDPRSLIQAPNGTILINENLPPEFADIQPFVVERAKGVRVYNPCLPGDTACRGGTWSQAADMPVQRWYPTVVTLKDGSAMIISGWLKNLDMDHVENNNNPTYEYYPPRGAPRQHLGM
ncbi:hypothetical protein HK104_008359 [Borealophlyctis nickersoniae]|nr:hypothetical protein HK104_008359 [Borealophlyctis nickersoniae]